MVRVRVRVGVRVVHPGLGLRLGLSILTRYMRDETCVAFGRVWVRAKG